MPPCYRCEGVQPYRSMGVRFGVMQEECSIGELQDIQMHSIPVQRLRLDDFKSNDNST